MMRATIWQGRMLAAAALFSVGLATAGPAALVQGQGEMRVVSGTVVSLADNRAILSANTGPVTVQMGPDTVYEKEGVGSLSDIQPSQLIAVTGRPTGDTQVALQIRIFPAALSTVRQFQGPMEGANAGNLMTNAVVDTFADGRLTVKTPDQSYGIDTSPDTVVLRPEPATLADVQEGLRVAATGMMDAEDVLQASKINVLGAPGS